MRIELDENRNAEQMWEQVKWAIIDSASKVYSSLRMGDKSPKNVWWNDVVNHVVERKEVLGGTDEAAKERCIEAFKEEKRKFKRYIYQSKKKVNEQFGKNMNQDLDVY